VHAFQRGKNGPKRGGGGGLISGSEIGGHRGSDDRNNIPFALRSNVINLENCTRKGANAQSHPTIESRKQKFAEGSCARNRWWRKKHRFKEGHPGADGGEATHSSESWSVKSLSSKVDKYKDPSVDDPVLNSMLHFTKTNPVSKEGRYHGAKSRREQSGVKSKN